MSYFCRTDVTAVKLTHDLILVGIGSYINIFDLKSTRLLCRRRVLKGQKIYGIVCQDDSLRILLYGGRQFRLMLLDKEHGYTSVSFTFDTIICDDWLLCAIWTDNDEIALLTAHNVVQKWNMKTRELTAKYFSRSNSILYSGLILSLDDDILVFSGTVYSKVIIHRCKKQEPLHHLEGHQGVIFSIAFDAPTKTTVTTSDDRSVRIWQPNLDMASVPLSTLEYWEKIQIVCKHVLYGHTARVMRCIIALEYIISVGEDSAICFWNTSGELLKKKMSHQNGCIWSIDANAELAVTGGSDGSVQLHPLTIVSEFGNNEIITYKNIKPKIIAFTARGNVVILCEENMLYYYEIDNGNWQNVYQLNHKSTYKLMCLSTCKQIIAVVDMTGQLDIFIENCKHAATLELLLSKKLEMGKILSLHWADNRHLVCCCDGGEIFVITATINNIDIFANFTLPQCKERYLTASTIDTSNKLVVLGDRCGNIHFYVKSEKIPMKTLKKVHGNYGPTSLLINRDEIMSTGRDGSVKYFNIRFEDKLYIKFMYEISVGFDWVEKFLDKNKLLICGFQERLFVLCDIKKREKILEIPCGGGHRSWDALRYFDKIGDNYEEFVRLIYLKSMNMHISTFQLNKIVSRSVISGTHTREINCLSMYKSILKQNLVFLISGGEDTTLRISSIENSVEADFNNIVSFKHLSSVRDILIYNLNHNKLLLISGGGRAHLCIRILYFTNNDEISFKTETIVNYLVKGSDKQRKGKSWREHNIDYDPEMRIMSLGIIEHDNIFIIIAACSDAKLRLFEFSCNNIKECFRHIGDLEYHKTCILKVHTMKFLNNQLAISMTTTGEIAFWDLTNRTDFDIKPILVTKTNKAGINSFAIDILENNEIILATGGDDNAIHLMILKLKNDGDLHSLYVSMKWETNDWHSAQITGLKFFNTFLISTSIDQRITLSKWSILEDGIKCYFVSQRFTDISDVQGLDIVEKFRESVRVCVFGKGIEIMDISLST